jgi:hypothetical protein
VTEATEVFFNMTADNCRDTTQLKTRQQGKRCRKLILSSLHFIGQRLVGVRLDGGHHIRHLLKKTTLQDVV